MLNRSSSDDCPFCHGESNTLFQKNQLPILECQSCRHRFSKSPHCAHDHVTIEFSNDYFSGGTGCYDSYDAQMPDLKRQGKYYSKLLRRFLKSDTGSNRVLDVGAAAGFFLQSFIDDRWHGVGIEANAMMAAHGRNKLGLDIRHTTIEQFETSERFDAATVVQVLPHLIDPVASLQKIHRHLNRDGLLLVETWNCKSWTARCFGKWWHEYNPPSVLHWFTKSSLSKLLEENGFQIIEIGRPTKWISLGNGLAIVRKSMQDSKLASALLAPSKLIPSAFKLPYCFDDVFWLLSRKK